MIARQQDIFDGDIEDVLCPEAVPLIEELRKKWPTDKTPLQKTPGDPIEIQRYIGYTYQCPAHGGVKWRDCRKGCGFVEPEDQPNYLLVNKPIAPEKIEWCTIDGLLTEEHKRTWLRKVTEYHQDYFGSFEFVARKELRKRLNTMKWQKTHGQWYYSYKDGPFKFIYFRRPSCYEWKALHSYYKDLLLRLDHYNYYRKVKKFKRENNICEI